jgi:hypothetical protein
MNGRKARDHGRSGAPCRLDATRLGHDLPMVAALVLAGLVLTARLSGMLRIGGAAALAAMSLLWLVVNAPMEGPVLVAFTPAHGLTGGDLAGVTGLALASYRGLAMWRIRDRA